LQNLPITICRLRNLPICYELWKIVKLCTLIE